MEDSFTYEKLMRARDIMIGMPTPSFGPGSFKIIPTKTMVKQFRFPRSKGKRIQKKWKKIPSNFKPSRDVIIDNQHGIIYCHPSIYSEIVLQFQAKVEKTMVDSFFMGGVMP